MTTIYTKEEADLNRLPIPNRDSQVKAGDTINGITVLHFGYVPHSDKNGWYLECHCSNIFSITRTLKLVSGHTKSCGCTRVSSRADKDYELFINKCESIKPEGYDLSLFTKEDWHSNNLKVICPNHGVQGVNKTKFSSGSSCFKCGKDRASRVRTKSTEQFVAEAIKIHGDLYDYTNTVYKSARSKIEIFCKNKNKYFTVGASDHLSGTRCYCCFGSGSGYTSKTTEQFIEEANEVHGNLYDYSNTNYERTNIKVCIKCNTSGIIFYQSPYNHLKGHGCNCCKKGTFNLLSPANLYISHWELDYKSFIKVGITNKDVRVRFLSQQKRTKFNGELVKVYPLETGAIAQSIETKVLRKFNRKYVTPDEFPDGWTETIDAAQLQNVINFVVEQIKETHEHSLHY